jgi:beta-carotene hydroxylase
MAQNAALRIDEVGPADESGLARARAFEKWARVELQPLTGKFAWPTVAMTFAILAAVSGVAALTIYGYLPYWGAIVINSLLIYAIFTPLHEAVHGNIAPGSPRWVWLETLVGHIAGFVLLAPFPGYRYLHLHHHNHTNDPVEDPDYWVKSDNYFMVILRCMLIQPVYIAHLWKIARDPVGMRAFIYEMIYVASYPVIVVVADYFGYANEVLFLWILPAYIGVVLCPLMFDWPVHHPHTSRGRYTDSAILRFPQPLQFVMDVAFCGHTYHLIHHMYPRIPFYHYGTAFYRLEPELATLGPKVRDFR